MPAFTRRVVLALSLALFTHSSQASTQDIVLTVTGKVRGGRIALTMADLETLGIHSITTACPWFDGRPTFEGVRLADLLRSVGAHGDKLIVAALNDYVAEVPAADAEAYQPILAFRRNGVVMDVADRGPLFLIYPYDAVAVLRSDAFYVRSVWQISSIEVR